MESSRPRARHGPWLWLLLAAFLLRVAAQPLALLAGWPWLPPFEAWQSGALPYPVLLASQVVLAAAGLYAAVMVPRLVLGLTVYRGHWWLDAPLPTVFHLVLMTFLAVYGHYHLCGHPLDSRGA